MWELYGFSVIPNGFFVDENGILRYANIGGFEVRNAEHAQAIEELRAAPSSNATLPFKRSSEVRQCGRGLRDAEAALARDPENLDLQLTLAERWVESDLLEPARQGFKAVLAKNSRSARALVGLATVYLDEGKRDEALSALKQAWAIEPDNWIVRKQIWAVEHPEQFYPAINPQWQRERIKQEKTEKSP